MIERALLDRARQAEPHAKPTPLRGIPQVFPPESSADRVSNQVVWAYTGCLQIQRRPDRRSADRHPALFVKGTFMDNISPLAKTLAESNGIDWRSIQGTGDGGQVVEQDIINYLTRVMSGEEEPPATPVDLPPPDWTGDELPAGMSAEMLSQAGVDSDIAAMVSQPPVAQAPAGQGAQLEEDEFELDLEDEPVAEPVDVIPVTPVPSAPSQPSVGLGGLLSQLYQEPATPAATETPAAPSYFGRSPEQSSYGRPSAAPFGSEQPSYAQAEATQPEVSTSPSFTAERTEVAAQPEAQAETVQPVASADTTTPEVSTPAVSEPADMPAAEVTPEPQAEEVVAVDTAANSTEAVAAAQVGRPEKAVWFGVYLRRDADLSSASDLREQLNAALGQDVPLSLLVARAAQQHVGLLGLNTVAIQDAYAHRARSVGERTASLRDALSAIDTDADGQPDMLVVNAGTLDLDEVHYPDTLSLSVGRVVDGRAALSLNGDVETTKAAEFLAAVAQSLEAPVALII